MADKVRYAISLTPVEEVTEHYGFEDEDVDILTDNTTRITEVIATEIQTSLGGGSSAGIDLATNFETMTAATHGYAGGTAYIISAPGHVNAHQMPSVVYCDVLYIENTGYEQASDGAMETSTSNSTDYLTVEVNNNGTKVAILKAGESVLFPMRGVSNSNVFWVSSTAANGTSPGENTLGCKFLALT